MSDTRPGSPRNRQQRVLILVQNMNYAFDRRVQNEARALVTQGIGVTVICPRGSADEPAKHVVDGVIVRTYTEPGTTSGLFSYMREFIVCWLHALRLSVVASVSEGFAVVQACNPPDTYWVLGALWRLAGKRFVFDQHDLNPEIFVDRFGLGDTRNRILYRVLLWLERMTYRLAAHVIVPNESYRDVAIERGGVAAEDTTVVMSVPDHTLMEKGLPMPGAKDGYEHLVAYVGVMGPQDGVDRLIRTVKILKDRGQTGVRYVLIGFGDCLEELKVMSTQLELDDRVLFTGRLAQPELRAWLSAADLGVTPDPSTPFTERSTMNKTLEYMACELPTVGTDLVETRRSAGDAALYVTDEAEMADAIHTLLLDPELRSTMGKIGRRRICEDLAWEGFAAAYVDVILRQLRTSALDRGAAPVRPRAVDDETMPVRQRRTSDGEGAGPARRTVPQNQL